MKHQLITLFLLFMTILTTRNSNALPFARSDVSPDEPHLSNFENDEIRKFLLKKYLISPEEIQRKRQPFEEPLSSSTTQDPLEEFCKSACPNGYGGETCDCADHPIG